MAEVKASEADVQGRTSVSIKMKGGDFLVPRLYIQATGDLIAAALLEYLLYRWVKAYYCEFSLSDAELEWELWCPRRYFKRARELLVPFGVEAVRAGSAGTYRYTMNVNGLMQELGFRVPDCIVAHEEEQARKKGGYEPPPAGFGV